MHRHYVFGIITLHLLCLACVSSAQSRKPVDLDIDFDFRSRVTTGNRSLSGLYSGAFRLTSEQLGKGFRIELYGARKSSNLLVLPSSSDVIWQQASVQKEWGSQQLQLGMIRLPFGIYDYRETYASGLIDYPLPRVDYGLNGLDWGVPGAKWIGGSPSLQVEAAVFQGLGAGVWGNLNTLGGDSVRLQTYVHDLILGVSRWDGFLNTPETQTSNAYGKGVFSGAVERYGVHLNGIDVRYTRPHLLLRGEYMGGELAGKQMQGWYLDGLYHLPKYERWTVVTRVESLRPESNMRYGRQVTLGVRYVLARDWVLAVNWRRNNIDHAYPLSWTPATGRSGDLFFQAYYKVRL